MCLALFLGHWKGSGHGRQSGSGILCQFPPAPPFIFQNPLPLVSVLYLQRQFTQQFQRKRKTSVKARKMNDTLVKLKTPLRLSDEH